MKFYCILLLFPLLPPPRSGVSWREIHEKERAGAQSAGGETAGGQEWRQLRHRITTSSSSEGGNTYKHQSSRPADDLQALRATEGAGGLEDETDDVLLKSFRNVGKRRSLIQRHTPDY